jgi:hypothetical protein
LWPVCRRSPQATRCGTARYDRYRRRPATVWALGRLTRNKIFFSCSPEDAHHLARHTLPELDEHELTYLDTYTAAVRLVVNNRQTAAFTMTTRPPRDPVGEATAIRQAVARPIPEEPTGAEQLAHRTTKPTDRPKCNNP